MYRKLTLALLLLVSFSSLQAEYLLKESKRVKSKIDRMPKNRVADMKRIPQDPSYYADQIKPFSKSKQKELDKKRELCNKLNNNWKIHIKKINDLQKLRREFEKIIDNFNFQFVKDR